MSDLTCKHRRKLKSSLCISRNLPRALSDTAYFPKRETRGGDEGTLSVAKGEERERGGRGYRRHTFSSGYTLNRCR